MPLYVHSRPEILVQITQYSKKSIENCHSFRYLFNKAIKLSDKYVTMKMAHTKGELCNFYIILYSKAFNFCLKLVKNMLDLKHCNYLQHLTLTA